MSNYTDAQKAEAVKLYDEVGATEAGDGHLEQGPSPAHLKRVATTIHLHRHNLSIYLMVDDLAAI